MVKINKLKKSFGARVLFDDVNLSLDISKRYGLIGANGAGKTTFLKVLCGLEDYDSGEINLQNGKKFGVLGQNQLAYEKYTLFDTVLLGNKVLYDAIKQKEKLYEVEYTNKVGEELSKLEMICVEQDPSYEYEVHITKILEDLKFPSSTHNNKMSTLSNSDKFKILLAQVIYPKPDVLYLDEPTNNLDINTISWLENILKKHEGTLVVISHDRHFLNAVCTHILDVDFKQIREFVGNYDNWYMASTILAKQLEVDRSKTLKEQEELKKFVARFSANASKAKQATSRQKQLDKLELEPIKVSSRRDPSIVFKANRVLGKEVLMVKKISKNFDDLEVLKDISFSLNKDDKVALIGNNGVGKTTLCKIINEELKSDSGSVAVGATLSMSYFPQDTMEIIKGDITLYDWLREFDKDADISEIRTCLGRMLFNGTEQEKKVSKCSGGEKHRMMISKIMLEKRNFLLLDEPTGHLDLEAIIALGEAILAYDSPVLCVSHDREFLDIFANRIIHLQNDGSIIDFKGGYEQYLEQSSKK
jgi:ATPase subunit of ABC transporter with duplicated ATPase domains